MQVHPGTRLRHAAPLSARRRIRSRLLPRPCSGEGLNTCSRWILTAVHLAVVVGLFTLVVPAAVAQVTLTAGTPSASQNFDTLVNTGTPAWADNSTLAGWYAQFGATTNPTAYTP